MLIFYILKKRLKLLIWVTLSTTTLAAIYVFLLAQPVYTATAKLVPTGDDNSISNIQGLASQFGFSLPLQSGSSIAFADIYPEIVKSRKLTGILLDRKFNTRKYGQNQTLLTILARQNRLEKYGADERFKRAGKILQEDINISKARLTSIITLEVGAFEPDLSAALANAIISESDKLQRQFKTHQVAEKRSFIEGRIKDGKVELETAQEGLKKFRERNRQVQYSPALMLEEERLTTETEVQKGIFITLKQQYELAKIEEVEEGTTVQVLDEPVAPYEKSSPKVFLTLFLAMFIGLSSVIFIAIGMEGFD
jgi:uncharacterized protein involved in exopolysaccharide biosynthesis